MSSELRYTVSSGNVFADIGRPDADELLVKAELVRQISHILEERSLPQTEAAAILRTDAPTIAALVDGRLSDFSLEQLIRFLTALDRDVQIVVKPKHREQAQLSVAAR